MQHTLYPNIDELLTPAALSRLTGQSITAVQSHPLEAFYNKSGSRLLAVETNGGDGPRYILKGVSLDWDWQMRATGDHSCRSVGLWQYGILDRLPSKIRHGVIACARDGDGWAILMQDVSRWMLPYAPIRKQHNKKFLAAMAALHATFLNDPALKDPNLNLCTTRHVYTVFGPETGRRELGRGDEVPQRILEGWELVKSELPADVVNIVVPLVNDPTPLCNALARYPFTLVHGDWRHANQGLIREDGKQRTILLDWQLATAGAPAIDIARYLGTNSALFPVSKEKCINYYRKQLARRLGNQFDESWWQPQLELALLGGFVQDGWAIVLKATTWDITAHQRDHWQADLHWWVEQVRTGAKWL
ncbi:MAG: hypothetical protein D6768_18820 [Chloroflexi bacterium]|nr:MAG: hypothetical protein D6768_18820 [Chloroflexota bacterium]